MSVTVIDDKEETASNSIEKDVGALEANVENLEEKVEEKLEETQEKIETVEEKLEAVEEKLEWNSQEKQSIWNRMESLEASQLATNQAVSEILEILKEDGEDQENLETAVADEADETVIQNDLQPLTNQEVAQEEAKTNTGRKSLWTMLIFGR